MVLAERQDQHSITLFWAFAVRAVFFLSFSAPFPLIWNSVPYALQSCLLLTVLLAKEGCKQTLAKDMTPAA